MPDLGNTSVFSQTDANNSTGTMPSWLGSAAPSTLDDAGRALQGAVTREWNWRGYTLTAGGTADAKTLTYAVAPAAYYNGQRFAFIANTTNTGSATLNINSLGAKVIREDASGTLVNLSAGDMDAGTYVEVAYNAANDCFVWVNQKALKLDASGNALHTGAGKLGYGTGTGGLVIQSTSKTTAVTINKTNGAIQMSASALAANSSATFTVNNSTVAATDVIILSLRSGSYLTAGTYRYQVDAVAAGQFQITVVNVSGVSLSEALGINFAVINVVNS